MSGRGFRLYQPWAQHCSRGIRQAREVLQQEQLFFQALLYSPMVVEHKFALVAPQSNSCVHLHRHSISGGTVDLASLFLQRRLKVIEQNLVLIKEIISHRAFFFFFKLHLNGFYVACYFAIRLTPRWIELPVNSTHNLLVPPCAIQDIFKDVLTTDP